jgi:hypothetical protein
MAVKLQAGGARWKNNFPPVRAGSLEMICPKAQVLCDRHHPRRPCVICSL